MPNDGQVVLCVAVQCERHSWHRHRTGETCVARLANDRITSTIVRIKSNKMRVRAFHLPSAAIYFNRIVSVRIYRNAREGAM